MDESALSWLIYHPRRERRQIDGHTVHFDGTHGNQDPYVWADRFLHTYCHMTQLKAEAGGIHLWVSGNTFPNFTHLYCDLVFVVTEKQLWREANHVTRNDPIVDSSEAFTDHYRWHDQHKFTRRKQRHTLKADPRASFQPQTADGDLIDIIPLLERYRITLDMLHAGLRAGFASRPMRISHAVAASVAADLGQAKIRLTGRTLRRIRLRHSELASRDPRPHGPAH